MWNLIIVLLSLRKAKKLLRFNVAQVDEIARNASAYGWEIGAGAPTTASLDASANNPFLKAD